MPVKSLKGIHIDFGYTLAIMINGWSLQLRLLASHLIVMLVGMLSLLSISWYSSARFFSMELQRLLPAETPVTEISRADLAAGFETAWTGGACLSVVVGSLTAGLLGGWVALKIAQPLEKLKAATQHFAEGDLKARVPRSSILELDQLSGSFNTMAASLENVERRRRELLIDLTHELRTPLTIIEGSLEGVAAGLLKPSPELCVKLARESARLKRLVNEMQEFSKADGGHLNLRLQPVALEPLLQGLMAKFSVQQYVWTAMLELELPEQVPTVRANPDRLEQILVNLLSNALRYTPNGKVTLGLQSHPLKNNSCPLTDRSCAPDSHQCCVGIFVSDTGIGIAAEDLPKVFDRFWRAKCFHSSDSNNTGLGLAIAKRLSELQGGKITVESQLGVGSTFTVWLPVWQRIPPSRLIEKSA